MERSRCLLLTVLGVCLAVGAAQAVPVSVLNPGFEDPALDVGGFTSALPGWNIASGAAGIIRVTTGADPDYPLGGYSDLNAAYSGPTPDAGSMFYQWLGVTALADTRYTLSVQVGDRSISLWNTTLPEQVRVELHTASGWALTPVAALSSTPTPADGEMVTWPQVFDISAELAGQDLAIVLGSNDSRSFPPGPGAQVQFDDVALDVSPIPEPMTATLLISGIGGLVLRRRK